VSVLRSGLTEMNQGSVAQEQCPYCGQFWTEPAYPYHLGRDFIAGMVFALIGAFLVGMIATGQSFNRVLHHDPGFLVPALGGFVLLCVVLFFFLAARRWRIEKMSALANVRRCRACGYRWTV